MKWLAELLSRCQPYVAEAARAGDEISEDAEAHRAPRHLRMQHHRNETAPFSGLIEFAIPDRENMLLGEHRSRAEAVSQPVHPIIERHVDRQFDRPFGAVA